MSWAERQNLLCCLNAVPARCAWVVTWAFSPFLSMSVAACIQWHFLYASLQRITRKRLHAPVGFPGSSAGKESACNAGDLGSIPGLGRSPEEGKGYPVQYSGLENSMDCIARGVSKSWIWLSDFHFYFPSAGGMNSISGWGTKIHAAWCSLHTHTHAGWGENIALQISWVHLSSRSPKENPTNKTNPQQSAVEDQRWRRCLAGGELTPLGSWAQIQRCWLCSSTVLGYGDFYGAVVPQNLEGIRGHSLGGSEQSLFWKPH